MLGWLRDLFRIKAVYVIELTDADGHHRIWPYYGLANDVVRFFRECPSNFSHGERPKEVQAELDRRSLLLKDHIAAVEALERDVAWLKKAKRVMTIG